jgi:hypothetical protein
MAMSLYGKTEFRRQATLAVGAFVVALGASSALAQQAAAPAPSAATTTPAKAAKAPAKKQSQDEQTEATGASASTKKDPAEAIRQVDGGIKLLQANKAEQAIQTLSVAISSGALPSAHMARALHQRGAAYRMTAKPALAISDLTSALWLKGGLAEADRQDAVKQRTEAYREAGLPDQTGEDGRPAGATATKRATATSTTAVAGAAPVATASLAPNTAAAAAPSSNNLLQTLFGGLGKSQPAPAQPAPVAAAAPVATSGASGPATSAWSSAVQPARTPRSAATAATSPPATAPAPVKTASLTPTAQAAVTPATPAIAAQPGVHARIALVRNEAEAQPILDRLKSQHAAALGKKSATLSPAQFGGMGAFVQVRVGPYPNMAEANAFCAKLKGSNLDCVAVDR